MNIHRITYNPSLQSCSLYFIGCNFRCRACYWKKIYPSVDISTLSLLDLDDVIDRLKPFKPRRVIIISGDPKPNGEFTVLPKRLFDEFGCEVRLMTNGYILPSLRGLSHVSISIKAMSDDLHRDYTGRSNRVPLENFRFVYDRGVSLSSSSVYIPGLIEPGEIMNIARFIASVDEAIPFRIIGYMPVNGLPYRSPVYEEVESVAEKVKSVLANVTFSSPVEQDYSGIVDLFTNNLRYDQN